MALRYGANPSVVIWKADRAIVFLARADDRLTVWLGDSSRHCSSS